MRPVLSEQRFVVVFQNETRNETGGCETGFRAQSRDVARLISVKCVALLKINASKDYKDTGACKRLSGWPGVCIINAYYWRTSSARKKLQAKHRGHAGFYAKSIPWIGLVADPDRAF